MAPTQDAGHRRDHFASEVHVQDRHVKGLRGSQRARLCHLPTDAMTSRQSSASMSSIINATNAWSSTRSADPDSSGIAGWRC